MRRIVFSVEMTTLDLLKVVEGLPKTELVYWRDSYVKSFEAEVLGSYPTVRRRRTSFWEKQSFITKVVGSRQIRGI